MNLPITLARFVMIPVYLVVFFSGQTQTAFFVLVLAGLTDVLDGYLARKKGLVTTIGSMLDPLADKMMMLAVIISLLVTGMIPWLAALVLFLRDASMIIGSAFFHFRGKKTVPANTMGKLTTVLYYIAIMLIFFKSTYAIPYLWIVIAFSFATAFIYIVKFKVLNEQASA
jgi:cardiolipin synthase